MINIKNRRNDTALDLDLGSIEKEIDLQIANSSREIENMLNDIDFDDGDLDDFDPKDDSSVSGAEVKSKPKKHNYTSEIRLKSILIRLNNDQTTTNFSNGYVNKLITLFEKLNNLKYKDAQQHKKAVRIKRLIKSRIIYLSENLQVDKATYEEFGKIIILMISRIMTRPQFYSYTYKDEFYSDAYSKILKYRHNFNHKLISERSGTEVNAFAYISQIIHNSFWFVIKQNKRVNDDTKNLINSENLEHDMSFTWQKMVKDERTPEEELMVTTKFVNTQKDADEIQTFIDNVYDKSSKINIIVKGDFNLDIKFDKKINVSADY